MITIRAENAPRSVFWGFEAFWGKPKFKRVLKTKNGPQIETKQERWGPKVVHIFFARAGRQKRPAGLRLWSLASVDVRPARFAPWRGRRIYWGWQRPVAAPPHFASLRSGISVASTGACRWGRWMDAIVDELSLGRFLTDLDKLRKRSLEVSKDPNISNIYENCAQMNAGSFQISSKNL